jgi:hypothetical protein
MIKLLQNIANNGISPNGLYLLLCINNNIDPKCINVSSETRILEIDGFLKNKKVTDKGKDVIKTLSGKYEFIENKVVKRKLGMTPEDLKKVAEYREIFPRGILPSQSPSRVPIKELEKKFTWFFNNYNFDWDIVIRATKKYVNEYEVNGYLYMKTSGYFVSKLEKNGLVSALASYCDMIVDGTNEDQQTKYLSHNTL